MGKVKILQHNMGKGRAAMAVPFRKIQLEKYVLIQEPYSKLRGLLGYDTYKADGEGVKAITLVRKDIGKVWIRECLCNNVIVIEMDVCGSERNVLNMNVYDELSDARNRRSRFREVSGCLQNRRERVTVTGEFNDKNVM